MAEAEPKLYSQSEVDAMASRWQETTDNLREELQTLQRRVQELESQPVILSGLETAIRTAERYRSKGTKDKRGDDGMLMEGFRFLGSGANAEAYDVTNALDQSTTVLKMIPFRGMTVGVVLEALEKARKEAVLQQVAYRVCPEGVVELRQVFQYVFPGSKTREGEDGEEGTHNSKSLPPLARPIRSGTADSDRCFSYSDHTAPNKAMLVLSLEKCDHGDLVVYLESINAEEGTTAGVYFQRALPLLLQVAAAVLKLATKGIEHKDLHGRNVFVTQGGAGPVAKIGDFGIADEDETPGDEFCESLRGLGWILFEILNEHLSNDADEYDEWNDVMQNLTTDPCLPKEWDQRMNERNCLVALQSLKGAIRKATRPDNLQAYSVEKFASDVQKVLQRLQDHDDADGHHGLTRRVVSLDSSRVFQQAHH